MKKMFLIALGLVSFAANATVEDGVPVLGKTYTEGEEKLVRDGARLVCEIYEEFEDREQCAMDYYAAHNYQGEPDCDE